MNKEIEKTLLEQLQSLSERLTQLVEINSKILHLVEFPVNMIWTAETGWRTKKDLEKQTIENSARLARRLARRRPSEAMIREWLNEY